MLLITGVVVLAFVSSQVEAMTWSTQVPESNCSVDICFLVDESGSVGAANWAASVIPFLQGVVAGIIGNFDARAGVVTFSTDADCDQCPLASMPTVQNTVGSLTWDDGETYLALGLEKCRSMVFDQTQNDDRQNIVILLTDGEPNDPTVPNPNAVKDEVDKLVNPPFNADIIPIAVGTFNTMFLNDISTVTIPPNNEKFFQATEFSKLVDFVEDVVEQLRANCNKVCPDCDGSILKKLVNAPTWSKLTPPMFSNWPIGG